MNDELGDVRKSVEDIEDFRKWVEADGNADMLRREAGDGKKRGEDDWTQTEMDRVMKSLPHRFQHFDRMLVRFYVSRARRDKKIRKLRAPKKNIDRLEKLVRDFDKDRAARGTDHLSDEYVDYLWSEEWRRVASDHRQRCNHRCQLCGASGTLEVHHTPEGYRNLRHEKPEHLLAVCRNPCHKIADMMREGYFQRDAEQPLLDDEGV